MRRRDTRCKQWKRVHDVPLSSPVIFRLCLFHYLSLHLPLGTSLSFSSLFSVTRQHIYVHTLAYTLVSSLSLSHPLSLTSLFFSFSSCCVLSLFLFRTRQRNTAEVAAAAAAAAARYMSESE